MDHLILPEGAKPWMKLAYDCPETEHYENIPTNGFEYTDFYKRVGWSYDEVWAQPKRNEDLLGGVEEGSEDKTREPWEVERLYQTWILFGLIIEVFALSGIKVVTRDFLAPTVRPTLHKPQTARLVTTAGLPELIKQWRQQHQSSRDDTVFEKVLHLTDFVGRIVDYHCANGKDHRSIYQYGKVLWPLSDETTTASIAVAFTLRKAAFSIYNKPGIGDRWPVTNSRLLYQRIQRKWCKSDAAMIMEDFDIDGQNYIAAATGRTLEELDGHHACTDHSCEAKIADGTYETQHDPECQEDDYEPEPSFLGHVYPEYGKSPATLRDAIKHTMDAGHLPVLRWDAERKGLMTYGHEMDTYSEHGSKCPPFVAISHVWADGKGNPFDNSLPYCQLSKLQLLADDLCANHLPEKRTHSTPGFWMDTLCCIVGNTPEDRSYKKKSIQSMREIYGESVAVLIVDPWLMSIPSSASVSEICYRIYASGWSRRLWTHQEGFLAREVYYQFQDKPLKLPDIDELATEFQKKMAYLGCPIGFPLQASGKTSFYYTTVKTIVNGIKDGRIPQDNKWIIYNHLASSLGYRSTTNIDDELLCVASVIGSSVATYANLAVEKSRQRTAELRMKAFLEEIGRFRQSIIFNNYQRLTIPGFRWAPASLLGHRASGLGGLDGDEKDSKIEDYSNLNLNDIHFEVSALNIKVNINKYIPRSLGIDRRFMSVMLNDKTILLPTVGLPVDYPGYIIRFSSKTHGLTVDMAERRFGVSYSPLPVVGALFRPPSMPKTPALPKIPSLSKTKLPSFGKHAPSKAVENITESPVVSPTIEHASEVLTYKYVVFVAENDVEWAYDREYVLIVQRPLGEAGGLQEFLAMVGRKSVGPGKRYWVQSLCSAVVRAKRASDDRKVDTGIDYVDVSQASTNWVVT
ncbi:Nn.00g106070.m01.CDS01 [Neocucurbitaria sp. VM-36]